MRSTTGKTALLAKQRAVAKGAAVDSETPVGVPYLRIDIPGLSKVYTTTVLAAEHTEDVWEDSAIIAINDPTATEQATDFRGQKVYIGWGYNTTAGSQYSNAPAVWVVRQRNTSRAGKMVVELHCIGRMSKLDQERTMGDAVGSAPDWEEDTAIYDGGSGILEAMLGAANIQDDTGGSDNGSANESGLLYKPNLIAEVNDTVRTVLRRVMPYTGSSIRYEEDDKYHIIWTQNPSPSADYTYSAAANHPPIYIVTDQGINLPNRWFVVDDLPNEAGTAHDYIGQWDDTAHQSAFGLSTIILAEAAVGSDGEAADLATSFGTASARETMQGAFLAHMNCFAEVYDYISCIDSRSGVSMAGWCRGITRRYEANEGIYAFELRLGGLRLNPLLSALATLNQNWKREWAGWQLGGLSWPGYDVTYPGAGTWSTSTWTPPVSPDVPGRGEALEMFDIFTAALGTPYEASAPPPGVQMPQAQPQPAPQLWEPGLSPLLGTVKGAQPGWQPGTAAAPQFTPQPAPAPKFQYGYQPGTITQEASAPDPQFLWSPLFVRAVTENVMPVSHSEVIYGNRGEGVRVPYKGIVSHHITDQPLAAKTLVSERGIGEAGGGAGYVISPSLLAGYSSGTTKEFWLDATTGLAKAGTTLSLGADGLKTDNIGEFTSTAGVTIDTLLIKDGTVDGVDVSTFKTTYDTHDHSAGDPTQVDHGTLLGLTDDDHSQYVLHTEVDDTPVDGATTDPVSSNWAYDHAGGADPHAGYRLESADHSHQTTGLQGGKIDHGLALDGLGDDDHTQYLKESGSGGLGSEVPEHGHAQHTNRTRNLWLPAPVFVLADGSPTLSSVHTARGAAWLLDSTVEEYIATQAIIPEDWVSGTVTIKTYYSMASANTSKSVVLRTLGGAFADGDNLAAQDFATSQTLSVPDTANVLDIFTHSDTFTVAAGELMQLQLGRVGGNANDDATGDLQFLGIELEYTADM